MVSPNTSDTSEQKILIKLPRDEDVAELRRELIARYCSVLEDANAIAGLLTWFCAILQAGSFLEGLQCVPPTFVNSIVLDLFRLGLLEVLNGGNHELTKRNHELKKRKAEQDEAKP